MTAIHTLASGSSGNALVLSWDGGRILVDAGISCRRIRSALLPLDISLQDLNAVLITHTHSDHISGLQTLLKNTACPVFSSPQAGAELLWRMKGLEGRLQKVLFGVPFSDGSCAVTAFPTSHDAPGSCGYRFDTPGGSVGLLTDSGVVTPEAAEVLPGVSVMILEANHDVETLKSGPYPAALKRRILGPRGHLCNEDAGRFAAELAAGGTGQFLLAHLSAENNTPVMAWNAVARALAETGDTPSLSVLPRSETASFFLEG